MSDDPINILLIEDNLGDARLVKEALAEIRTNALEFDHAVRLSDGLKKLHAGRVDVVLLDLSLPDASGLETVRRTHLEVPHVPIVILTGLDDEGFALKAVREGAQDYLVKGQIDGNLLFRAMRYAIERHQLLGERKRAEEALHASEEYALNLIESSIDMIIASDRDGNITEFNKAAQRTFGYRPEEILHRNVQLLYADPAESAKVHGIILKEGKYVGEVRSIRQNGQPFPCFLSASTLRDSQDHIVGVVSISRDITEQLNLETQLRHSQKMESVGQLAGGIAHDFNNMLTVIQGHASLLLAPDSAPDEVADAAQQISLAAERAGNLTRQLLAFSRKQRMLAKVLDLNELVANMIKMLRRILGEDIVLRVNYAPALPCIDADQGMMEQVILNLAVNARDAMPNGGQLVIETSLREITEPQLEQAPEATPGQFVCLSVKDSGCGIAAENLQRVFEPFFTTKEPGKGTGLGLATVYGIAKQHHGWIKVSSELGNGSDFQIILPSSPAIAPEEKASSTSPENIEGGNESILLVEDDLSVRALVLTVLECYGYKVFEAPSGRLALDLWQQHRRDIDLLFTDIVMPGGITGCDLANQLWTEKPDLKVIFTSGYSEAVLGKAHTTDPRTSFLQKPYHPHEIASAVRACLDA